MAESILGKINYLTEEQYQNAKANGQINENEIYLTPDKTKIQNVRLFYNADGYMGNIPLRINKSQFEKLRIIYASNGADFRCAEIPTTLSTFCLYGFDNNGNGTAAWMKKTAYTLAENEITIQDNFWKNVNSNEYGTENCIRIIEVIGISASDHIKSFETTTDTYSTAETIIGEYKGKPLYRKIIDIGTPASKTTYPAHKIENFKRIINVYGSFRRNNLDTWNTIPGNYSNWESYIYDFTPSGFTLKFSDNQWNNGINECEIVLEYTKTTD
jgi:hypothetical protein